MKLFLEYSAGYSFFFRLEKVLSQFPILSFLSRNLAILSYCSDGKLKKYMICSTFSCMRCHISNLTASCIHDDIFFLFLHSIH